MKNTLVTLLKILAFCFFVGSIINWLDTSSTHLTEQLGSVALFSSGFIFAGMASYISREDNDEYANQKIPLAIFSIGFIGFISPLYLAVLESLIK